MNIALNKYLVYVLLLLSGLASGLARAADLNFNGTGSVANCTRSGASYTCSTFGTDHVLISSGVSVTLTGSIQFDYNQRLTMSGTAALRATGDLNIGNIQTGYLNVTGGTLTAGGKFSVGAQVQTLTANVVAASMDIGTGSTTKLTGSLTSSGPISIASHATVTGTISGTAVTTSSPVILKGDVSASTSFVLASGSSLTGNLVSPIVDIYPSDNLVTGNITATTRMTLGNDTIVTGNIVGGRVELQSSNATIKGTAAVDFILLGYHGRVEKGISCNAGDCNCIDDQSNYKWEDTSKLPVCIPKPVSGPDHFLITHSGSALTCQPQTVTVTACANAACTAPHFTGSTGAVTLTPGGYQAVFVNGIDSNAKVQQSVAGNATLKATSATTPALATTCRNTGSVTAPTSCQMAYADSALVIEDPKNHVSESAASFTVRALTAAQNANGLSCVPLFANTSKVINFGCSYVNPASGGLYARVGPRAATVPDNVAGACRPITAAAPDGNGSATLAFDDTGKAKALMKYADVGKISLQAAYKAPNGALMLGASGSFIVAPASFSIDQVWNRSVTPVVNASATGPAGTVLVKAGQAFAAIVTARNQAGNVTPNFGAEQAPHSATLTHVLQVPPPPAGAPGILAGGGGLVFAAGSATATGLAWSETGIITLNATLSNPDGYLGSAAAKTLDANGALLLAKGSRSNVGRFIPDHFDTSITAVNGVPITCGVAGSSVACPGDPLFVYSNQVFGVTVTALNTSNAVTLNYHGGYADANTNFAKTGALSAWSAAGGTALQNPPAPLAGADANSLETSAVTPASFIFGVAKVNTAYRFGGFAGGATTVRPAKVFFRAADTDAVTSLRATGSVEAGVTVVSGRLLAPNAYGSERLSLPVNLRAQYFGGAGLWLDSVDDKISTFTAANATLFNCTKQLSSSGNNCGANVVVSNTGSIVFKQGKATLRLPAMGPGSVDLRFPYAVNSSIRYLPSNTARLVFGLYSSPLIYMRELY